MPTAELHRTPKQAAFIDSERSVLAYIAGVGAGKSYAGGMWKLTRAIKYPKAVGLIAANTANQLNTTTMVRFKAILEKVGIDYVLNKRPPAAWGVKSAFDAHEGVLTLRNGRQEFVASLINFEMIRGKEISDAWLDETRDTDPTAITVILGRMRGFDDLYPGIKYLLRITTTPNGFDHIWDIVANPDKKLPDSDFIQASTSENFYVPGFAERLMGQYGKKLALQEIEGQFVNLATGKAFVFSRDKHVREIAIDETRPLYFSLDFNISPLCGLVIQMDLKSRHVDVLDEIYIPDNAQTQEACREFIRRWGDVKRTVRLDGDIAGKHRDTRTDENDHSIMIREITTKDFYRVEQAWDYCQRRVFHGVQAVNALLEPADESPPRLLIHPRCKNLICDLDQVAFKPGTQELDKSDKSRTHLTDALRYPIQREFPVLEVKAPPPSFGAKGFFG